MDAGWTVRLTLYGIYEVVQASLQHLSDRDGEVDREGRLRLQQTDTQELHGQHWDKADLTEVDTRYSSSQSCWWLLIFSINWFQCSFKLMSNDL